MECDGVCMVSNGRSQTGMAYRLFTLVTGNDAGVQCIPSHVRPTHIVSFKLGLEHLAVSLLVRQELFQWIDVLFALKNMIKMNYGTETSQISLVDIRKNSINRRSLYQNKNLKDRERQILITQITFLCIIFLNICLNIAVLLLFYECT